MKEKLKKLSAVLTALALAAASLWATGAAFAQTHGDIGLDVLYIDTTVGPDDLIWYTYTPKQSGTYCFLAYSTASSNAYLFTRTTQSDGTKVYNQLAFAGASDPDYMDYRYFEWNGTTYTHSSTSFCLTYHLDAGTKYFFAAGWNRSATTSEMRARLTCKEYDSDVVDHITATSSASLTWYTDGEWRVDAAGEDYFYYNPSKILQNMTVTLHYKDGSSVSATGADTIAGNDISYVFDQINNHWYVESDEQYNGNILTVKVLDKTYDYSVVIQEGALYTVSGKITDYISSEAVANASLWMNRSVIATTDENGIFSFTSRPGTYTLTVTAPHAIKRSVTLTVDAQNTEHNNHKATPIGIVTGDYVTDGLINGRDYAYIKLHLSGDDRTKAAGNFSKIVHFTEADYPAMSL